MVRLTKVQLLAALEAAAVETPPNATYAELSALYVNAELQALLPTDDSEVPPIASENLPSVSENLPSAGENLPSASENPPSASENLPIISETLPHADIETLPNAILSELSETIDRMQNLTSAILNMRFQNSVVTIHIQYGSGWMTLRMSLEHSELMRELAMCVHVVC